MKPRIAVFGGVHIDIWADYDPIYKDRLDQIGNLLYSIGGTGYNIAYVLSKHNVQTTFYSVLNANSYNTIWIKRELASTKIRTRFQINKDTFSENGFVAIRSNGNLERAVTSSYLSKAEIIEKKIDKVAKGNNLAIIDCNFETHQIFTIVQACKRNGLKILFAATSDSKVGRIKPILDAMAIDAVTMNEIEAKVFFNTDNVDNITSDDIPSNLKYCFVTLAERGHYLFYNGKKLYYPAPSVAEVASSSGCGDALLAAVAKTLAEDSFDLEKCNARIYKYVGKSLTQATTYLKPTRRKMSKSVKLLWATIVAVSLVAVFCSLVLGKMEVGFMLSMIGVLFAIAQAIRGEIQQ